MTRLPIQLRDSFGFPPNSPPSARRLFLSIYSFHMSSLVIVLRCKIFMRDERYTHPKRITYEYFIIPFGHFYRTKSLFMNCHRGYIYV